MSSKRRLRRKTCERKKKYSKEEAEHLAKVRSRVSKSWITSYKCKFCGNYHIGHPPYKIKQAIKQRRAARGA